MNCVLVPGLANAVFSGGLSFVIFASVVSSMIFQHENESDEKTTLNTIHAITTNNIGNRCHQKKYLSVKFDIQTSIFETSRQKADLVAAFLQESSHPINKDFSINLMRNLLQGDEEIIAGRIITMQPTITTQVSWQESGLSTTNSTKEYGVNTPPWFFDRFTSNSQNSGKFMKMRNDEFHPQRLTRKGFMEMKRQAAGEREHGKMWRDGWGRNGEEMKLPPVRGFWTFPYFSCRKKIWLLSYTIPLYEPGTHGNNKNNSLTGLVVFDVSIHGMDINQCERENSSFSSVLELISSRRSRISSFDGTHKCHNSSKCVFQKGGGMVRGGYQCECLPGFYPSTGTSTGFNGSLVEVAFSDSKSHGMEQAYRDLYVCRPCAPGCFTCIDGSECIARYNWIFRRVLLGISLFCILVTLLMVVLVYKYRKMKVFKYSSPTFLSLTLVGCIIMYSEMAAIFPVLDTFFCIATKWTRHLGFCITYTALLMKTWRVSLTYRVKSAHKLKLTDKQLLQWLFPILLIMVIYLSTWSISDSPFAVDVTLESGQRFKQCQYGWWDHSLAIGEMIFLLWGIKVCFNVRKARTYFDEAKLISYSIYNITIVNVFMAALHLFLVPTAGPDVKYFLGFLRTQLSTTVTIILVFGPKFSRVLRGTGNDSDDKMRSRGTATSMIGAPFSKTDEMDVYQENEELKEEVQKLASKIEFLKILGMMTDNCHLKNNKNGYFGRETLNRLELSRHVDRFNYGSYNPQDNYGSYSAKGTVRRSNSCNSCSHCNTLSRKHVVNHTLPRTCRRPVNGTQQPKIGTKDPANGTQQSGERTQESGNGTQKQTVDYGTLSPVVSCTSSQMEEVGFTESIPVSSTAINGRIVCHDAMVASSFSQAPSFGHDAIRAPSLCQDLRTSSCTSSFKPSARDTVAVTSSPSSEPLIPERV